MLRRVGNWALRRGARAAIETASEVAPKIANEAHRQIFEVTLPVTVFIHAAHSRVTVRRRAGTHIQLDAALRAAFGWQLVAEQDDAGVYIVARRKRVVGALSSADFTITIPPEARLQVQLNPGALILEDVDGTLDIPPIRAAKR